MYKIHSTQNMPRKNKRVTCRQRKKQNSTTGRCISIRRSPLHCDGGIECWSYMQGIIFGGTLDIRDCPLRPCTVPWRELFLYLFVVRHVFERAGGVQAIRLPGIVVGRQACQDRRKSVRKRDIVYIYKRPVHGSLSIIITPCPLRSPEMIFMCYF